MSITSLHIQWGWGICKIELIEIVYHEESNALIQIKLCSNPSNTSNRVNDHYNAWKPFFLFVFCFFLDGGSAIKELFINSING